MTKEDHLLLIIAEECNAVAQRCIRTLRFGLEHVSQSEQNPERLTNRRRINREFNDLVAAMAMLDANLLRISTDATTRRQARIAKYLEVSEAEGRLSESASQTSA